MRSQAPARSWRAQRANAPRKLRGHTLLELVVVVAMLAVLTAVVVPRFAESALRNRVEAGARRVATDLEYARQRARLGGANRTVEFDPATESYRLPAIADLDAPGSTYEVQLDEAPYEVRLVSATFGADGDVIFDGYGRPDTAGSVVVGRRRFAVTVSVDANGQVTIGQVQGDAVEAVVEAVN